MNCVNRFAQSVFSRQVIKSLSLLIKNKRNLSSFKRMPETIEGYRVLSIQSHVVHGYCGNKSAVFPLQVR
jgi:hypothetical protein